MKKFLAVLMCALMLATCLSLCAYAEEETTSAEETTAEEATIERTADKMVFNSELATRPNCIIGMNGLAKGSGLSKKAEWDGVKIDVDDPTDPNFAIDYKSYCKKYDLTPLNGEDVGYVVLKFMVPEDVMYDDFELFYCAGSVLGATQDCAATSEYCGEGDGFVYFIYNLDGMWEGAISMLRVDPMNADEGDVFYLMELAMFKTEDEAITWCDFDEEETEEPTTEAETEAKTEAPATEAATTEAESRPPREEKDEGCGGIVSVGAVVAMIALGVVCIKKKD